MPTPPVLSYAGAITQYGVRVVAELQRTTIILPRPAWWKRPASLVAVTVGVGWAIGCIGYIFQGPAEGPIVALVASIAFITWAVVSWNRPIRITVDVDRVRFTNLSTGTAPYGPDRLLVRRLALYDVHYAAHARSIFIRRRDGEMVQLRLTYSDIACEEVVRLIDNALASRRLD